MKIYASRSQYEKDQNILITPSQFEIFKQQQIDEAFNNGDWCYVIDDFSDVLWLISEERYEDLREFLFNETVFLSMEDAKKVTNAEIASLAADRILFKHEFKEL